MNSKKLVVGITAEGSVNLLTGQLAYFKSLGYETYLMAPYSERSAKFSKNEGCTHLIIDIEREISLWKDLKTLLKIIRIFKEVKPDIINLGTPKVALLGMIAGKILGIKNRIYTCRGFRFEHEKGLKRTILVSMEKITSFCANQIICISPSLKKYAVKERIFKENKTFVINKGSSNGVDLQKFSKEKINKVKQIEFLKSNNLADKFIFGFIGRLVKDKGIYELFNAIDQIYYQNKDIRLLVFGSSITSSNDDREFLKKFQNHPAILWLGFKDDIEHYISMFDVFVLPTHREGFGNVFIQSAAMGIPCIGTDIVGARDSIKANYNGLVIPPKNLEALKEAMLNLYSESSLRIFLGNNGIEWAKNFDRTIIWNSINQFYIKQ